MESDKFENTRCRLLSGTMEETATARAPFAPPVSARPMTVQAVHRSPWTQSLWLIHHFTRSSNRRGTTFPPRSISDIADPIPRTLLAVPQSVAMHFIEATWIRKVAEQGRYRAKEKHTVQIKRNEPEPGKPKPCCFEGRKKTVSFQERCQIPKLNDPDSLARS